MAEVEGMEAGLRIGLVLVSILVADCRGGLSDPVRRFRAGRAGIRGLGASEWIPLKTVEAGYGFEGMAPAGKIVCIPHRGDGRGDARDARILSGDRW